MALIFLVFNAAAIAMDRAAIQMVEQQRARAERRQVSHLKGEELFELLEVLFTSAKSITKRDIDMIEVLLNEGADVNIAAAIFIKNTPLHYAVKLLNIPIIKLLIEHGADVNKANSNGETPLHDAANSFVPIKSTEVAKLLIENGADIDHQGEYGETPLMRAVFRHNVPMVKLLIEGVYHKQIETLGKEPEGQNPTYFKLLPADIRKMALEYLKIRVNPNIRNKSNQTALDIARQSLQHTQNDPEFFRNIDINRRIADYEEIIRILEPVTSPVPVQQPRQSWWQRLWRK